jgi:hypothetical protein
VAFVAQHAGAKKAASATGGSPVLHHVLPLRGSQMGPERRCSGWERHAACSKALSGTTAPPMNGVAGEEACAVAPA